MKAPVVFLIFNRPDLTAGTFERIARARPPRLLVVADGPRPDRPEDERLCRETRSVIRVDWPCELVTEYADRNLGCRARISSGLDRAFALYERAVILEDDCLPEPSFFPFSEAILERFAEDERIMTISGTNLLGGRQRTDYSYSFSRYFNCSGWASWRRAWSHFDAAMSRWPAFRDGDWLWNLFGDRAAARYWTDIFEQVHRGEIDSWAFPWTFACWAQGALSVLPNVNLVLNRGFDERATHTKRPVRWNPQTSSGISFPLSHPPFVIRDERADRWTQRRIFHGSLLRRSLRRARNEARAWWSPRAR